MPISEVSVIIDDRERGSAAAAALAGLPGVHAEFRRLKVGDYQIQERLLVERKTLLDLQASVEDGRLFRQAIALAGSGQPALLILEGRGSDLAGSRMRREALQGALITVALILGIPMLRALDGEETARLILFAAHQLGRAGSGAVQRPGRRPRGKRRLQLHILQGLPGVGPGRAARLLERFGTVEAVITATGEDLREVPGLGKTTAARIQEAVREPAVPYAADPGLVPHGLQGVPQDFPRPR